MTIAYEAVIGLEVHAQLATRSKIFCSSPTTFGADPNHNTCPVCLGLPGALPVLNQQVVAYAVKAALAFGGRVQATSIWARKNYFYPDLPKGYQISQYEEPYNLGGQVEFYHDGALKKINLTRIHMEEDAGKLVHGHSGSLVDLNRAGTPLVEIVSEPEIRSASEAAEYLRALRSVLRYIGVCDGNMEEGSLRCDANVSLRPVGTQTLGTRAEIKNINSFRYVEKAILYEIERQSAVLDAGGKVVQETRLWDSVKQETRSMRSKEEAHDYRYFPDPDLPPLVLEEAFIAGIRESLPELPIPRGKRFVALLDLPEYDALVLTAEKALADYFESVLSIFPQPKKVSNWIMTELLGYLNKQGLEITDCKVTAPNLARLLVLVEEGAISGKMAKDLFLDMLGTGEAPDAIVATKGLSQISDTGALETVTAAVMAASPAQLAQYRAGKDKLFGFFVGQVMKETKGQANPGLVNELLKKCLS